MQLISKDFFKLQVDFAQLWSNKKNVSYDQALFENTCLYVRLLGYNDINRPSIQNNEWIKILNEKPQDTMKQVDYFYDLYIYYETTKKPSPPPTACFSYNYHNESNIFELHFINADSKGNFSKERTSIRYDELKKLFEDIKNKNHNDALVKIGTWMLNIDAFKRFFPLEFTEKATFLETPLTQNYTHWGQFLTKEGYLKKESALLFLNKVRSNTFDHINKYFLLPAKISFLELPYFFKFYNIS